MDELLTVKEVEEYLRVTRTTIYKLINRGAFPVIKIAGATRIKRDDLMAYIASATQTKGEEKADIFYPWKRPKSG